jgi:hypothetical protein
MLTIKEFQTIRGIHLTFTACFDTFKAVDKMTAMLWVTPL